MIPVPLAHVGGFPVEELLTAIAPALLLVHSRLSTGGSHGNLAVTAEHPPHLCPTSNAQTRQILKDGAGQIGQLAEQLGINIVTLRIFGPYHIILAVVEAKHIDPVRDFALQSRLMQWNTVRIHATYSIEEALALLDTVEPIF